MGVRAKLHDVGVIGAKNGLHISRSAVTKADPDYFRRRPSQETPLTKIVVLRHDRQPVRGGLIPDGIIVGFRESYITHMGGIWIEVSKTRDGARF